MEVQELQLTIHGEEEAAFGNHVVRQRCKVFHFVQGEFTKASRQVGSLAVIGVWNAYRSLEVDFQKRVLWICDRQMVGLQGNPESFRSWSRIHTEQEVVRSRCEAVTC